MPENEKIVQLETKKKAAPNISEEQIDPQTGMQNIKSRSTKPIETPQEEGPVIDLAESTFKRDVTSREGIAEDYTKSKFLGVEIDSGISQDVSSGYAEGYGQARAQLQSNLAQIANGTLKLPFKVAAGLLENVGVMVDIESHWGTLTGEGGAYNHAIYEAGKGLSEFFDDLAPLHEETPGEMNFSDPAWWYNQVEGLGESVAEFAITGMGTGAVISKGAKHLAKKLMLSKGGLKILQGAAGLSNAGLLAYIEGYMSANDVYIKSYEEARKGGFTHEQAKEKAGMAAATTVRMNTAINTMLNISSASSFIQPLGVGKKLNKKLMQKAGESNAAYKARLKATPEYQKSRGAMLASLGIESGQESLEEIVNELSVVMGEYHGRELAKTLTERDRTLGVSGILAEAMTKDETWLAAGLGAFGGMAQTGVTERYSKSAKQKREFEKNIQKTQIDNLIKKIEGIEDAQARMKKAKDEGDKASYEEAKNDLFGQQLFASFVSGTDEQVRLLYEDIASLTPEQAAEAGYDIDPSSPDYYVTKAQKAVKDLKELGKVYHDTLHKYNAYDDEAASLGYGEAVFNAKLNHYNTGNTIDSIKKLKTELEQQMAENSRRRGIDSNEIQEIMIAEADLHAYETITEGTADEKAKIDEMDARTSASRKELIAQYGVPPKGTSLKQHAYNQIEKRNKALGERAKKANQRLLELQKQYKDAGNSMDNYESEMVATETERGEIAGYGSFLNQLQEVYKEQGSQIKDLTTKEGRNEYVSRAKKEVARAEKKKKQEEDDKAAAERKAEEERKDREAKAAAAKAEEEERRRKEEEERLKAEAKAAGEESKEDDTEEGTEDTAEETEPTVQAEEGTETEAQEDEETEQQEEEELDEVEEKKRAYEEAKARAEAAANREKKTEFEDGNVSNVSGKTAKEARMPAQDSSLVEEKGDQDIEGEIEELMAQRLSKKSTSDFLVVPAANTFAYRSKDFVVENGKKRTRTTTKHETLTLELESSVEFQPGDTVTIEVDRSVTWTNDEGETFTFDDFVDPQTGEIDIEEYPIAIKKNGETVAFIRTQSWISDSMAKDVYNNVANSIDPANPLFNNVKQQLQANLEIRRAMLEKGSVEVQITNKSAGFLSLNVDSKGKINYKSMSELTPNIDVISVVKNGKFHVGKNRPMKSTPINTKEFLDNLDKNEGKVFMAVPAPNGGILMAPVQIPTLTNKQVEVVYKALETFFEGGMTEDQAAALTKKLGLDITSSTGMAAFLQKFIFAPSEGVKSVEERSLIEGDLRQRHISFDVKNNALRFAAQGSKATSITTAEQLAANKDALLEVLKNKLLSVKLETMEKRGPFLEPVIGEDGELDVIQHGSYTSFLKNNLLTDIVETEIKPAENGQPGDYSYFDQPVIEFDMQPITGKKAPEVKPPKKKKTTSQTKAKPETEEEVVEEETAEEVEETPAEETVAEETTEEVEEQEETTEAEFPVPGFSVEKQSDGWYLTSDVDGITGGVFDSKEAAIEYAKEYVENPPAWSNLWETEEETEGGLEPLSEIEQKGFEVFINTALLEYMDDGQDDPTKEGQPCTPISLARDGARANYFTRGSKWEVVKDLKGYPSHEKGGVDVTIGKGGVKIKGTDGKDIKAKNGLVLYNVKNRRR